MYGSSAAPAADRLEYSNPETSGCFGLLRRKSCLHACRPRFCPVCTFGSSVCFKPHWYWMACHASGWGLEPVVYCCSLAVCLVLRKAAGLRTLLVCPTC